MDEPIIQAKLKEIMVRITLKWNAKLIFLYVHSLPHTKLLNT